MWLAYIAKNASVDVLWVMGVLACLQVVGFLLIYINKWRRSSFEANGRIWWDDLRPIHAAMYMTFAAYALRNKQQYAWILLLLDAILGLGAWLAQHFNEELLSMLK